MRRSRTCRPLLASAVLVLAALAASPAPIRAQRPPLRLELHGGAGYTVVDRNKWSGYTDPNLSDWNNMMYQGYAQLFLHLPGVDVGLEGGYQYYWWYTYTYVITTKNYRTVEVSATHVHAVVRVPLAPLMSAELGGGPYFFEGGTDFGGHAALGLGIPLGPKVSIPIQVRADAIFDSNGGTMIPVGVTAGLAIKL